jgi:ABC-2 type transport system ATP-binding protein
MVIHHGKLIYDGALSGLVQQLAPFKLIRLTLDGGCSGIPDELTSQVTITEQDEDGHLTLRTGRTEVAAVTARVLEKLPVVDLAVEEPPIEAVIDQFYTEGAR